MPELSEHRRRPRHVVGVCGYSGAGKTTLVSALISLFSHRGLVVSAIKHAHHGFDPDIPGKDSWKMRKSGAFETLVTSDERWALIREFSQPNEPEIHALIAELSPCDWLFVEGFKHGQLAKLEVWREAPERLPLYPDDASILALATDGVSRLPVTPAIPVLPMDDPSTVAGWLLDNQNRFLYSYS